MIITKSDPFTKDKTEPANEYLIKLLEQTKKVLNQQSDRTAEDVLMYSTLFQIPWEMTVNYYFPQQYYRVS